MTYRDDGDALRAKVTTLEHEIEARDAKIAELTGEKISSETELAEEKSAVTGTTSRRTIARTLAFEIDADGYEAIARLVRERLGVEVAQVGRTLTTPKDRFSLRHEDGRTTIRMDGDWSSAAQSVLALSAIASFFGIFGSFAILHDLGLHDPALHTLWIAPAFVSPTVWLARRRAQKVVDEASRAQQATLEAVVALAEKHRVAPAIAPTRVAEPFEEEEPAEESGRGGTRTVS